MDDYLRPRISLSERPRRSRQREGVSNALAAFAAAAKLPNPQHRRTEGGEVSGGEPLVPVTPLNAHTTGRGNALEAIVDDLEDGMDVVDSPDPAAIDMKVNPTGKVTARKEEGTRISSPSQLLATVKASLSSRTREPLDAGVNPSVAGRAMMSYAAAIQAPPEDWHLEFSIDGRPVLNDTKGPSSRMPISLHERPTTSNFLRLLNILHELNANLDDVLDDSKETITLNTEPLAQFINCGNAGLWRRHDHDRSAWAISA